MREHFAKLKYGFILFFRSVHDRRQQQHWYRRLHELTGTWYTRCIWRALLQPIWNPWWICDASHRWRTKVSHPTLQCNFATEYQHIILFFLWIKCIRLISFVHSDVSLNEDQYALYGHKTGRIPRGANQIYDPSRWVNWIILDFWVERSLRRP